MKNKLIRLAGLVVGFGSTAVAMPLMALAQSQTTGGQAGAVLCGGATTVTGANATIQTIICKLNDILTALIPFLIALGIVYFIWGVVSYVIASDEEAKKTGRNRMIYGIIGLAVIVGVWGLVRFITNTFDLSNGSTVVYPTAPY